MGKLGYNEIKMILLIGTLGYSIRYTSEYIPKLQIHQQGVDMMTGGAVKQRGFFVIGVKGGEWLKIFPSMTKGDIVE